MCFVSRITCDFLLASECDPVSPLRRGNVDNLDARATADKKTAGDQHQQRQQRQPPRDNRILHYEGKKEKEKSKSLIAPRE